MTFVLAIVGRPNVGKSTLFNRLVGRRRALVDKRPGLTRDCSEGKAELAGRSFMVVDTPGFERERGVSLEARMFAQTRQAIQRADICLFVIDAREDLTALDRRFSEILHRSGKRVVLVANKCEGRRGDPLESMALGFGSLVALSAEHGEGFADLYTCIADLFPEGGVAEGMGQASEVLKLAVIGRPNAGKSTLINAFVGEERVLTGPEAGLTRDSIELGWFWGDREIRLVDTAGMRRRSRIVDSVEKMSVAASLRSIRRADVVVLTMEAESAFERQDVQLADLVLRSGRGLVLACAQWDRLEDREAGLREMRFRRAGLPVQARDAPLVPVSALEGYNLDKLMQSVVSVFTNWSARVRTRDLNDWLQHMVRKYPPPAPDGKRIRPRYLSQIGVSPPVFVLMSSRASAMPESYRRYLVKGLRESFDFQGSPVLLHVRQGSNPYAPVS